MDGVYYDADGNLLGFDTDEPEDDENIEKLSSKHDCNGCFGASFNDCFDCPWK